MDFLVEMTTHVPPGTPAETIDDVRAREAVRAREFIAEGHLRRLWRPPLAPGKWRTFGLFTADDADQLEDKLASMALRVWRTDVVTPLPAHPNDPGRRSASPQLTEFLTTLTITAPPRTAADEVDDRTAREAVRAAEFADLTATLQSLPL